MNRTKTVQCEQQEFTLIGVDQPPYGYAIYVYHESRDLYWLRGDGSRRPQRYAALRGLTLAKFESLWERLPAKLAAFAANGEYEISHDEAMYRGLCVPPKRMCTCWAAQHHETANDIDHFQRKI